MFLLKMLIILFLSMAIGLLGCANAVISNGPCPGNISVKQHFKIDLYLGIWNEYSRYEIEFEKGGKCIQAEYTRSDFTRSDNDKIRVKNSMINASTGEEVNVVGYATPVRYSDAKWEVNFHGTPTTGNPNYLVLDTDYISYSVVYSCQMVTSNSHSTYVWILTRQRETCEGTIAKAKNVLKKNHISLVPLVKTPQAGCRAMGCGTFDHNDH